MANGFAERRSYMRARADIPAHVICNAQANPVIIRMHDISAGGLACWLPSYVAPATPVTVAMILAFQKDGCWRSELVEAEGVVVRTVPEQEQAGGKDYLVGISFSKIEPWHRYLIALYMS